MRRAHSHDPARRDRVGQLRHQLRDARGGRVVFVSHCLLNENVRYLGGATRSGAIDEVVLAILDQGVGLVQMPCPEQQAWGGVLKPLMLLGYGRGEGWARYRSTRLAAAMGLTMWSRATFAPLARRVAREIADYQNAGMRVVGVVGVRASPSCGVGCTLALDKALDTVAGCPLRQLTVASMNDRVVAASRRPGPGLFVGALQAALSRRGVAVPFLEHDLLAELDGAHELPDGLRGVLASSSDA